MTLRFLCLDVPPATSMPRLREQIQARLHAVHSLPQLLAQGRTVVAAVRSAERAKTVFGAAGLAEGRQPGGRGILFVEAGVDITSADTITPMLFAGVSQVVTAVGAVFGRTAEGAMG
jgi:hypothetical protein